MVKVVLKKSVKNNSNAKSNKPKRRDEILFKLWLIEHCYPPFFGHQKTTKLKRMKDHNQTTETPSSDAENGRVAVIGGSRGLFSEAARESSLEDMQQSLLENIGDWLDSESVEFQMMCGGIEDPKQREETNLHELMATAAMNVLKRHCVFR